MTGRQFRALALSLPEAVEVPHFERASFRVGKKIFATLTADGRDAMVGVKPREKLYGLLKKHPRVFFTYGNWTVRIGALGVHLAEIDAALMRELLVESWRSIAPKRAQAALEK